MNMAPIPAEVMEAVFENYRVHFFPDMQKLEIARPNPQDYFPVTPAAIQLQYAYIVKNPYPGGRRKLAGAADGTDYSRVHAKYHHAFRNIIEAFGYYDLYLIDYDTGHSMYDVNKDRDFGTSFKDGPYSESNLAKVMRQCLATANPLRSGGESPAEAAPVVELTCSS